MCNCVSTYFVLILVHSLSYFIHTYIRVLTKVWPICTYNQVNYESFNLWHTYYILLYEFSVSLIYQFSYQLSVFYNFLISNIRIQQKSHISTPLLLVIALYTMVQV